MKNYIKTKGVKIVCGIIAVFVVTVFVLKFVFYKEELPSGLKMGEMITVSVLSHKNSYEKKYKKGEIGYERIEQWLKNNNKGWMRFDGMEWVPQKTIAGDNFSLNFVWGGVIFSMDHKQFMKSNFADNYFLFVDIASNENLTDKGSNRNIKIDHVSR